MRSNKMFAILSVLLCAVQSQAKLEAHEWGTFTSLVGSDGITQNGMYHEDEVLPQFVHGFGAVNTENLEPAPTTTLAPSPRPRPRPCFGKGCFFQDTFSNNVITQKMETPVIYFYSDKAQRVEVNVQFPQGVITETYPAPVKTSPTDRQDLTIANGNTTFVVDVLNSKTGNIPYVESSNIYSHARNVNSNIVRTGSEEEKFIFYRGLGRFQPTMGITSSEGNLNISFNNTEVPRALFLVHVNNQGRTQSIDISNYPALKNTKTISQAVIQQLSDHNATQEGLGIMKGTEVRKPLIASLVSAGLNPDEARAMIDTWENGYLKVPGLRLLYILPQAEVERTLPLKMSPAPDQLARVFVGRIEILLDTEEARILKTIRSQMSSFSAESLGRFAEPILRRVQQVYLTQTPVASRDAKLVEKLNLLIQEARMSEPTGVTAN